MNRISNFINRFSFSRKLALTFFFCTLITFAIIDITLHVLYSTVVISPNQGSRFNTQAFSQFSNSQILSNSESYLLSGMDNYQQIITNAYNTYNQFINDPTIYISKLKRGSNPPLTSSFTRARYDRSSIYFYTPNSTFYDHPFLDKVLASSATDHYPSMLKRINIIYQSKSDPTDITIRTLPGTKDFYVPNAEFISQKIRSSVEGTITNSDWYYDQHSLSSNQTQLLAIRFLMPGLTDYYMLFQVQIMKQIVDNALKNIYSFPYTSVVLLKMINNDTQISILGENSQILPSINISQYLEDGSRNITIDQHQFLVTTRTLLDDNNEIHEGQFFVQTNSSQQEEFEETDQKLIIFSNKSEIQLPNIIYDNFQQNQYSTLTLILYGWSFIVLLVVASIGVVIGDIIFSYFSLIRKRCRQYLQNPQQLKSIEQQMKQFCINQPKNKVLFENIVQIMKGIENKKKQNRKNFRINYDTYPLNPMGIDFQNRMGLKDYNKLQEISYLIKQKQQSMRK